MPTVLRLSNRAKGALQAYALGHKAELVCQTFKYTRGHLSILINSDVGKEFLKECQKVLDDRFQRLYSSVIDAIEDRLTDPKTQLEASNLWLKAHGKFSQKVVLEAGAEEQIDRMLYGPGSTSNEEKSDPAGN
jgi:hypothetical protein